MCFGRDLTRDSIGDLILYQPQRGYRFSLDAVLLAGFVRLRPGDRVLELGAGCGVVSLFLARRFPQVRFWTLEIQDRLTRCLSLNIRKNNLTQRVFGLQGDLCYLPFKEGCFSIVVTNPPFYPLNTGRLCPDEEERLARHEVKASLEDVLAASKKALKERGRFYIIYPASQLVRLMVEARKQRLEPKRLRLVYSYPQDQGRLVLLEAIKGGGAELQVLPPLFIYVSRGGPYAPEVEALFSSKGSI